MCDWPVPKWNVHDNTQCRASIIIFFPHTLCFRDETSTYIDPVHSAFILCKEHVKYPFANYVTNINWNDLFCWLCDRVIREDGVPTENPSAVKKLVFCSGKVYYDLMKARNEKNLDRDIAVARVEQVQIIFFCCKIIYLGYSNTQALFHWWYEILVALSNILPCFYKEISLMVVLHPCVCPLSKIKFQTTLQGFHSIGTLDSGAFDKCSLDLPTLLTCRSPHFPMIWWRKNVQNIQMLSCAGPRKKLRTRVPGLMCNPASTPHLMDLETSGRCDACTWLIDIR